MYIRTKDEKILDMKNTNKCIYVIRDTSKQTENCYVSYLWDNWKKYHLIDYQNCMLFSYNSAQSFISDLIKENLNYQNLVIELSPYYKDCEQSESLEELCDCIIETKGHTGDYFHYTYTAFDEPSKERLLDDMINQDFEVYYAIWTSKGLIYVAKMNDKGELELI